MPAVKPGVPPGGSVCEWDREFEIGSPISGGRMPPSSAGETPAALIDMDRVIYRENQLIRGAKEFVRALIEIGTPFIFLTNNS